MNKYYTSGHVWFMSLLIVIAFLLSINSYAQQQLLVTKITGGINFDGIPDEPFWQSVEAMPLVMLTPVFGIEPSEETVIKIAYDDEYFYVSGWLNYNNPTDIRAVSKKRDYSSFSSDFIGFILVTYNNKENAVSFHTNPNGLRTDGTVKNDCADWTNDGSFSWNTFWDVKTHSGGWKKFLLFSSCFI